MICLACGKGLLEVPVYNNNEDILYPPSFLFCNNSECSRFGLLTVVFKNEEDKKDGDEGVLEESLPSD